MLEASSEFHSCSRANVANTVLVESVFVMFGEFEAIFPYLRKTKAPE